MKTPLSALGRRLVAGGMLLSVAASYPAAVPTDPDIGPGTLVAIGYQDAGFRFKPDGNFVDRGDLYYSSTLGDWWEYDYHNGIRLTHKSGFDGIGVNIYVNGVQQNTAGPVYLQSGVVYFEAHPNTASRKTVRVEIADKTYQDFLLQTGLDLWR